MRFLRRTFIGAFLLAITAGLLAFAGDMVRDALVAKWAEEPRSRPARERVFAVNVEPFTPETIRPVLTTFGDLRARRSLEVRSPAAGEVQWISDSFEEGGRVTAGEVLVRIDPVEAQSALDTARADMTEAEADLRDSERALALAADDIVAAEEQLRLRESALARQQDLLDRGVGATERVETAELNVSSARQALLSRRQAEATAETRLDQARIMLERRKIALAEAERRLADTEVFAAFDGVLSDVTIAVGRQMSANERIAELVDPTALEVAFRVSTPQYARLLTETGQLVGADVTVSIDVGGVDLATSGKISRESAAVEEGQTGRLLFARLERAPGFRPGDFVTVRIDEPPLNRVARLPASALDAASTLLVVGEEDRLEVAQVELLRREGDDVIVRARGMAGREVVSERTPLLGAGIKVRPIRSTPEGETEQVAAGPEMLNLDPERRARLVAFVEANNRMPSDVKNRILGQLQQEQVPANMVNRLESRM